MKVAKYACMAVVAGTLMLGQVSCSMSNTGKGALLGGGGGGALGAGIGALIGGGKGAAIGAGIGAAVGAGAGALIGNRMDKQQKALEEQLKNQAKVEQTTDQNGLQAIKVTFDGGILFPTNGTTLNNQAKVDLTKFAQNLVAYPGTLVQVYGYTDNTGTMQVNERVSTGRAAAVKNFLEQNGVPASTISSAGIPMADYIASNDTAAGRAENRRVEIYISASPEMVKQAEAGTLK